MNLEKYFSQSPKSISFTETENILAQMKNYICKIHKNNGEKGTGFLCNIPYPNQSKLLPVLITSNHVLNENDLENDNIIQYTLKDDDQIREIIIDNNRRKIYTSEELDVTFIEIKQNEDNINNFLEIDEKFINKKKKYIETTNSNKSIYILHYPLEGDISVSYGIIDKIKNEQINHFLDTSNGSSGSPIISLDTFKVIGIHCGSNKDENENCNKGIFIKYPINLFNKKTFTLSYKLNPNGFYNRIFGDKFVENNINNIELNINENKSKLVNKCKLKKGDNNIKIIIKNKIKELQHMFDSCKNLKI
jgi:hypothetical protein